LRPLALFDPDLVDQLVERTRELGIDVHLGTEAIGTEKSSGQLIVRAVASEKTGVFQTDMVMHAAGRVPEITDLNLDAAGIDWEKWGVRVNEFLQSVSIPAVYAAGDAAASGGSPLAPVASYLRADRGRKPLAGKPSETKLPRHSVGRLCGIPAGCCRSQ
jgi:glutathione reductase (NADPH)